MKRNPRNFKQHAENRRHLIAAGSKPEGFCSRCADVWCLFNVTPGNRLPTVSDTVGKTRQYTCNRHEKDYAIPGSL